MLDAAIDTGANSIGGGAFGLRDEVDALHRAREAAMQNARAKAAHYAALAGATLGDVLSIAEGDAAPPACPMYARAMPSGGGATTIEAGKGTITVTLQMLYALLSSDKTGNQATRSS